MADWILATFACLVSMNFVKQMNRFIVSYLVAVYYFHEYNSVEPRISIRKALKAARCHVVSIIWGAYFIPHVNLMRLFKVGRNEIKR